MCCSFARYMDRSVATAASVLSQIIQTKSLKRQIQSSQIKATTNKILAHLKAGRLGKAVSVLFSAPFPVAYSLYANLFQICSANNAIVEARKIQSHLVTYYPNPPIFLLNRAIETFGKCGCLEDARELFEEMPQRNGGSWNAIITAYAQKGCPDEAISLFTCMRQKGVSANEITFASVLGSCAAVVELGLSTQIHGLVLKNGFSSNVILGSALVDVYGKCHAMCEARKMFHEIQYPNEVSWNVIVRRHLDAGDGKEAFFMFSKMLLAGIRSLNFTFSNALVACSSISLLKEGMQIHAVVYKIGFVQNEVVSSSLVNMYVKCNRLNDACRVFYLLGSQNLFSWTSIVSGYAAKGRIGEARRLFDEMPERNVLSWNAMLAGYTHCSDWEEALDFVHMMRYTAEEIDHVTLSLILNVCAGLSDLQIGKQVHCYCYRHGFCFNLTIANALLDMYGKCGSLYAAKKWFYQMSNWRDLVSWNTLLTTYARHGLSEQAMALFGEMQWETTSTKFTFGTLLAACANIFALHHGKQIHGFMIRHGYDIDIVIRSALVDMYCKCRCVGYAFLIFREADSRDVILWNTMILGCCYNHRGRDVLELFRIMEEEDINPDHTTFHGILLACIDEGLVEAGTYCFQSMSNIYCVLPRLEHYQCMIELYGRHGFMYELENFVKTMTAEPTASMLTSIADFCYMHGHAKLGAWAAKQLNHLNS